jgi:hypothetical protein
VILLGILHVDVDTAIRLYREMSEGIFGQGFSIFGALGIGAGYNREPLKDAVARILRDHSKGRTRMVDPGRDRGCRVSHRL